MTDSEDIMAPESAEEPAASGVVRRRSESKRGPVQKLRALDARIRWGVILPITVLALIGVLVGVEALLSAGRIHPGVKVGTVAVGGMTQAEAVEAIRSDVEALLSEPATLTVVDRSWPLDAESIGASVDATGAAKVAYTIGRGEDFGSMVSERVMAWLGSKTVALPVGVDRVMLDVLFDDVSGAVAQPARDAAVVIEDASVRMEPSATGLDIDREDGRDRILSALVSDERVVTLELGVSQPRVDEDAARQALEDARAMLSGPLTLTYEDKSWEVSAEEIGTWIMFSSNPTTGTPTATLVASIASEDVSATVLPMVADVGKVARNASFKASSGTVTIVPHQDGLTVDAQELAVELTSQLKMGERSVELRMRRVEPEITTEDAQAMGINERISTFTTDYSASNLPRVNNIHTLADALDGTLLAPGETFSFNGTVGERTAAKGYQEANAIVNGKLVPQLGGGICQVGTTIFNTVFFSGLPVVERYNHSQYISHYPKGRDATVSWGGPDFKFKNDTENWMLIATGYTNSTVTISLYGTDPGYDVTYKTGEWTDIKPYPVREIEDATMPIGMNVVEERGVTGRSIVVTRTVTKGGEVVREDSFKSVYRAAEEVIRVGTMPAQSEETSTPAP